MKKPLYSHVQQRVGLFACVAVAASILVSVQSASAAASVVAWGDNSNNQIGVPPGLTAVAIAAGGGHNVAIQADGTVAVWGYNPYGQLNVPAGLNGVMAASAGYDHSLALLGDGTVVAWGRNFEGQCNVPAGLNSVVAVSAAEHHSLALKSDGSVIPWGNNGSGQGNIPAGLGNVVAISAGTYHCLALKNDGTVVGWGANYAGQATPPAGLANVMAIAAGVEHSLALKNDGTVVAWGDNSDGQATVPAGLSGVVAISAGSAHSLALKNDGTVVAWGYNAFGQGTVPAGVFNVQAISSGFWHNVALVDPDDQLPRISCPQPTTVECGKLTTVTSQVSDPEGDALVVVWSVNGTAIQTNELAAGSTTAPVDVTFAAEFPLGTNHISVAVTDSVGNTSTCSTIVTVVDTTPPVIVRVRASPDCIWPPNHKMVAVRVEARVTDACGPTSWKIISIKSSQAVRAKGSGKTAPDWKITGDHTASLRAERSGKDGSRIYTITVQAKDGSGNLSARKTVEVTVPHDMGHAMGRDKDK